MDWELIIMDWELIRIEVIKESLKALILVFFIGVGAKLIIERFKYRLALTNELSKLRVEKIAECWKAYNGYILRFYKLDLQMREKHSKEGKDGTREFQDNEIVEEFKTECDKLRKELIEIEALISSHRFWLGEKIERKTCKVFSLLKEYYIQFCENNLDFCLSHKEKIKSSMMDVDDVLYYLLQKINRRWLTQLKRSLKSIFGEPKNANRVDG